MKMLMLAIVLFGYVVGYDVPPQTSLVREEQGDISVTARPLNIIELSEYHVLEVVYKNDSHKPIILYPHIEYYWVGIIDYNPKNLYLDPGEEGVIEIEYFGKRLGWYKIITRANIYVLHNLRGYYEQWR